MSSNARKKTTSGATGSKLDTTSVKSTGSAITDGSFVYCGDRLISVNHNGVTIEGGEGVRASNGAWYATLSGHVVISSSDSTEHPQNSNRNSTNAANTTQSISIKPHQSTVRLPTVNDFVVARITRITSRAAHCIIYSAITKDSPDGQTLREGLPGIIRSRDVRSYEIDSVEMINSYRPGDIIRALVLSLGDSHSYYLSTADQQCGVIMAFSAATQQLTPMRPVSWTQMQCPITKVIEQRKVAQLKMTE